MLSSETGVKPGCSGAGFAIEAAVNLFLVLHVYLGFVFLSHELE